jgi:predicted nucleic acid-binding protein
VILLDTSVLSLAFRRRSPQVAHIAVAILERLIAEDQPMVVPGVVLQEILSGVRTRQEFDRLLGEMEGFQVVAARVEDHLKAAQVANACRSSGIASSAVDCLIAAQAINLGASLFTLDQDFGRMASCCELDLFE